MSRTRSQYQLTPASESASCTLEVVPTGAVSDYDSSYFTQANHTAELTSEMTDSVEPSALRKIRSGTIVNNYASRTSREISRSLVSFDKLTRIKTYDGKWKPYLRHQFRNLIPEDMVGTYYPTFRLKQLVDEPDIDQAYVIQKAWADLDTAAASALSTIGELPETLRYGKALLNRACKVWRFTRKTLWAEMYRTFRDYKVNSRMNVINQFWKQCHKSPPAKWPRNLRDCWLEARYAIRPLVYDLHSYKSVLGSIGHTNRMTGRSYAKDKNVFKCGEEFGKSADFRCRPRNDSKSGQYGKAICLDGYDRLQFSRTSSIEVRAGVLASVAVRSPMGEYAHALGLHNIPESAWDLLPFSFIIDWFVDVSTLIESWTPEPGVTPLASWVYVKHETADHLLVVPQGSYAEPSFQYEWSGDPGTLCDITTTWERTPDPPRSLLPHLRLGLTLSRAADLVAILTKFCR